jgi:hypothetical protein
MHVGDRVMPRDGLATGTIEGIRNSKDGYTVAEIRWDTGARCAEPLVWLGRLEDVQAANQAREAIELRTGFLWTFRDGKVVSLRLFDKPAEALEAAGLSE